MSKEEGPGRPAHEPTEANIIMVSEMTSYGITQDVIAKCIGISEPTLRLHYRDILDTAKALCIQKVANRLMDKINEGDTASTMFYLKTQAGWREKDKESDAEKLERERQERINQDVQARLNAETK